MAQGLLERIKRSRWNQRFIKNDRLDKFLNGVFWFFLVVGIVAVLGMIVRLLTT